MKKRQMFILIFFAIIFASFGLTRTTYGEEFYSIHVVKYQLQETIYFDDSLEFDGDKIPSPVDNKGEELQTMEGIQYQLEQVVLKDAYSDENELSSYSVVEKTQEVMTTNSSGEAVFNGLSRGTYRLTELDNPRIQKVMDPVLVTLPLESNVGRLTNVYLYPKSSVLRSNQSLADEKIDKLPQTSGEIKGNAPIIVMVSLTIGLGFISLKQFKKI